MFSEMLRYCRPLETLKRKILTNFDFILFYETQSKDH